MTTKKIACIDDAAYQDQAEKQAAGIRSDALNQVLVQAGLFLWQRYTQGSIADLRQELADRRMKLAENLLEQAKLTWEKEKAFVDATMDQSKRTADYSLEAQGQTASDDAYAKTLPIYYADMAKLGIAVDACDEARTARGMAITRVDLMAHQMRTAEARAQALNDRRHQEQYAVLGLGKGVLRTALSLGSLGGAAATVVRDTLLDSINSGINAWGYNDNRWSFGGSKWKADTPQAPRIVGKGQAMYETDVGQGESAYKVNVVLPTSVGDVYSGSP